MRKWILGIMLVLVQQLSAQETFPVNGVVDERPGLFAFTNAVLYADYQTKIENATLVIKDGKVVAVGAGLSIPKGAIVTDLKGKFIYPAFVDPYTNVGMPEVKRSSGSRGEPQYESARKEAYGWNDAINADFDAASNFSLDKKSTSELRKLGFGSVITFRPDGIVRGTGALVNLSDGPVQEAIIKGKASAHYSFNKGTSNQPYPNSIMGMVALLRQTYYDAKWYASSANEDQVNLSLQSFNDLKGMPAVFEANGGKLRVLLADKVGDEFGVQYIIKGAGDEYQRAKEIKATNASLIIPLEFPDAYDVDDPLAALDVSLADMKHWEMAASNAKILTDQGIEIAFTVDGLKKKEDIWKNLRLAVERGLTEAQALKAFTYTPAKYFNAQNEVGILKKGSQANFFISSDNIFDEKAKIHQTWVGGVKYDFSPLEEKDFSGKYSFSMDNSSMNMELAGEGNSPKSKIVINDTVSISITLKISDNRVVINYTPKDAEAPVRLSGWVKENGFAGIGQLPDGTEISWKADRTGDLEKEEEKKEEEKDEETVDDLGSMIYPFVANGWMTQPTQETILFKNATVWTLEGEEKLENADVLVQDGKISQVGKNITFKGAKEIDATDMHLTPGIVDEHSHAALSSVNEGSASITAEVRMYDAIDSEDIDIYRQLAGGVTAAQLLHGSANPVGGQSALVKFRWGVSPEAMKIKGADGFIKFALGENVKQSNWGDDNTTRFPQTRMGTEMVYVDGFTRAKEYGEAMAKYNALSSKVKANTPAPRRDLRVETLLEIINEERFITCHSYVQSEINMLMKVAEDFDFRINTFTHILEGYKVADKMAKHGAGGSTFADWWAYKWEVRYAIPYNASLMSMAGVTSAINSDDAEMARRLNQEAAKSVKYGGMSEIEALKLVTLNPAKLLHLDDQMGSIKVGKDADLVLWDEHPLSVYAKANMTLVDGIVYYSKEKDAENQKAIAAERTRLINKMKGAKAGGAKTQKAMKKEKHMFHCEDIVADGTILNTLHND
ncbi:MAG: amidohydrolase family protein [Cyclobacteriaceae bacterium]